MQRSNSFELTEEIKLAMCDGTSPEGLVKVSKKDGKTYLRFDAMSITPTFKLENYRISFFVEITLSYKGKAIFTYQAPTLPAGDTIMIKPLLAKMSLVIT